jgi:hypothetical protein
VLKDFDPSARAKHIFDDINGKLPVKVKNILDGLEADKNASPEQKDQAYEDMVFALQNCEKKLFRPGSTCWCILHEAECKLFEHSADCGRLTIEIAGHTCKDVSRMNSKRPGLSGPSGRVLLVWMFERRRRREDLVITECTQDFPPEIFEQFLGMYYEITSFLLGPEQLGWWVNRKRRFCILCLRPEFGGKVSLALSPEALVGIFGRSRPEDCMKGDMFYAATDLEVRAAAMVEAQRLHLVVDTQGEAPIDWDSLIIDSKAARREAHRQIYIKSRFKMAAAETKDLSLKEVRKLTQKLCADYREHPIVDLDQTAGWGGHSYSGAVMTLIGHGSLYSFVAARCMLGDESFLCQGVPRYGLGSFRPPWGDELGNLTEVEKKNLAGNSIHVHVIGCILAYVLVSSKLNEEQESQQERDHKRHRRSS